MINRILDEKSFFSMTLCARSVIMIAAATIGKGARAYMEQDSLSQPSDADQFRLDLDLAQKGDAHLLDPEQEVDKVLLEEFEKLKAWAGVTGELRYWEGKSTGASSKGIVGVNEHEMSDLYGAFSEGNRQIALFMVLAHEVGHLCQYKYFGVESTGRRPRKVIEVHADLLSGAWLGVRLARGNPDNLESARAAALKLTGGHPAMYPPAEMRALLVVRGRSYVATLMQHDQIMRLLNAPSPAEVLTKQDVESLYDVAEREHIP